MPSMDQQQVSTRSINTQKYKIRSAIDMLLSSDSVEVTEPSVQLTECSPEVDIIMNKQGGICTRCNTMFKSRSALMSHPSRCVGYDYRKISGNEMHCANISIPIQKYNQIQKIVQIQKKIPIHFSDFSAPQIIIVPK